MIAQTSFQQHVTAKLEFYLLCITLFVLPTMESPKTITLVLYLIVWTARRFSLTRLLRFRPRAIEVCLMAMLIASAASTAFNWPFPNGAKGLSDTLRLTLLFWCIYRAGYDDRQQRVLAQAVTLGLIVGIAFAVFELASGRRPQLELHSAGVLTQSAMYVSIVFVLALGIFLTRWLPRDGVVQAAGRRWPWLVSLLVMSAALILMGSRGALFALGLILIGLALLVNRAKFWALLAAGGVAVATALLAIQLTDDDGRVMASVRFRLDPERLTVSNRERLDYMRIAVAQIREGGSWWLGIGPRNFQSIDVPRLHFDPPLYLSEKQIAKIGHAHNLFLTKLVEEGLAGLAALGLFFGLVAHRLWRAWRRREWYAWPWFAGVGASGVTLIAGSVNTPFYQEHAMLAMALMAIFMASSQPVGHRR